MSTITASPNCAPVSPLLAVDNLTVGFKADDGMAAVVEDVSFELRPARTLGLVGESGSGKSVTAQAIMRLLPEPPARILAGKVLFEGHDLCTLDARRMRELRGDRIAMIFQEPMTSLNPTMTVGSQITEVLRLHRAASRADAERTALAVLRDVGIGAADRRLAQYPHELSGGLRQRVMIAMALACRPAVLIADEPTTALDVTVQAQVLELLGRLRSQFQLSMLLITHDLGVVGDMCDDVAVMYAGRIVEIGPRSSVLERPHHPYTLALLECSPRRARRGERLTTIAGNVPPPGQRGAGCSFADRCPRRLEQCHRERPPLAEAAADPRHRAACWNPPA